MSASSAPAQSPGPAAFRSACDLIDAADVAGIVGAKVRADDQDVAVECSFSRKGDAVVDIELLGGQSLPLLRLTLPAVQYTTVGDRTALVSPGDKHQPATTAVALDDGVLEVAVTKKATGDRAAASSAIAQAILAAGPVTTQPPATPGLTPLAFDGDECDLVTAQDLKEVMGSRFRQTGSGRGGCVYGGGSERSPMMVLASLTRVPLETMRTKRTTDVTVAGRPGLLIPKAGTLMVDIGGRRVLQLGVSVYPIPKGSAARKLAGELEQLAERAVGRMTPVTSSAAPTTSVCDLLGLEALSTATGVTFTRADPLADIGCDYSSADQRTGVIVTVQKEDGLDAAWSDATETLPLPKKPESTTVGGLPALDALVSTDAAVVAADLSGTPDGDGKVLGGWCRTGHPQARDGDR